MKHVRQLCITILVACMAVLPVSAQEEKEVTLDEFVSYVESTEYYKEYENEIEEVYVTREAETEEGKRYTRIYLLKSDNDTVKQLSFVGNSYGEILVATLAKIDANKLAMINLQKERTVNVNLKRGPAREPVMLCGYNTCVQKITRDQTASMCSDMLGGACSIFKYRKNNASSFICKASVIIIYYALAKDTCIKYAEVIDICDL